jgi:4-hydroxy-4-methyl-2-oxoglutarate aldolase
MTSARWEAFGTGVISDCMGRFGAMDGAIRRLVGERLAGPATTVEVVSGENGTIHRAVASAEEGSVLVVAAGGGVERAVWGEVLAQAAVARGVLGVVIDGAVRDVERLQQIGLTTYARGACPLGPHKGWPGRTDLAIACGGVVVQPADMVVGDADGVVVIPAGEAARVYDLAAARQQVEAEWLERVAHGESTVDILNLREETK